MPKLNNEVRIVGGEWRSRRLKFPSAPGLRPTPDRVRETLFNWLGQRLDGLHCLDLFAGSGALGFEALSRGAASVVMVERDARTARALRVSGDALGAKSLEIVAADALAYLRSSAKNFDVVFLDPPFASDLLQQALDLLPRCLAPGATVYVEAGQFVLPAGWTLLKQAHAGQVQFALITRE